MRHLAFVLLLPAPITARAGPDISAPLAHERAKQGKLLIIDVRTPEEWRETGVMPQARRVDFYRGPQVLLKSVLEMVVGQGAGFHAGLQPQGRDGRQRSRTRLAEPAAAARAVPALLATD